MRILSTAGVSSAWIALTFLIACGPLEPGELGFESTALTPTEQCPVAPLGSFDGLTPQLTNTDPRAVELGVKFRVRGDAVITGVRFYKSPANVGLHEGHLWSASGQLLATAVFTNETALGWQHADFPAPVQLTAGVTYVVSYLAPNGRFSYALAGSSDSLSVGRDHPNGPASILADGQDGGNGVYRYGGGFPANTYRSANYFVDPVIDDLSPPSAPGPLFASAPVDAVHLSWSASTDSGRPVHRHFIYRDGVLWADVGGAATSYVDTAVFAGTSYTYRIAGEDFCGNVSADSNEVTVTPSPGGTAGISLYGDAPPVSTASSDPRTILMGHRFRATRTGTITHVRFWRDVPDPAGVPFEVALWRVSDGWRLATGTWAGGTFPGWQEVSLSASAPVAIDAHTDYVAAYRTTGQYSSCTSFPGQPPSTLQSSSFAFIYEGTNWTGYPTTPVSTNFCVDVRFLQGPPGPPPPPPVTPESIFTTAAPSATVSNGSSPVEVGVKVESQVAGTITGVRFYRPDSESTFTVSLWSSSGALLARTSGATGTTPGWRELSFAAPVAINPATRYVASVHVASGRFVYTVSGLTTGITNGNLTAPAASASGGNGVYRYGAAPVFPTLTFQNTNYWVDVVFVASVGPTVATVYNGVEPPAHPRFMGQPSVELGVKWYPTVSGVVRSIRFFRDCGDPAGHSASLWTSGGSLLGRAQVPGHGVVHGWQTATFATPVAVTANTTYVASYHVPGGCFDATLGSFGAAVITPYLVIPSTSSSGGNGVYRYNATPTFPDRTNPGANYWVDVELEVP